MPVERINPRRRKLTYDEAVSQIKYHKRVFGPGGVRLRKQTMVALLDAVDEAYFEVNIIARGIQFRFTPHMYAAVARANLGVKS